MTPERWAKLTALVLGLGTLTLCFFPMEWAPNGSIWLSLLGLVCSLGWLGVLALAVVGSFVEACKAPLEPPPQYPLPRAMRDAVRAAGGPRAGQYRNLYDDADPSSGPGYGYDYGYGPGPGMWDIEEVLMHDAEEEEAGLTGGFR